MPFWICRFELAALQNRKCKKCCRKYKEDTEGKKAELERVRQVEFYSFDDFGDESKVFVKYHLKTFWNFYFQGQGWWVEPSSRKDQRMRRGVSKFCDSNPPIPWHSSSIFLILILQISDSDLQNPWLWSSNLVTLIIGQVEKFVAKVKAEKERARKALEMEARREQGAVSLNFYFRFSLCLLPFFRFFFHLSFHFIFRTNKDNKKTNAVNKQMH